MMSLSSRKKQELLGGGVQSISQASSDAECIVDVESVDEYQQNIGHGLNVTRFEISSNQSGLNPIFIENDEENFNQDFINENAIINIEQNVDADERDGLQSEQYDEVFESIIANSGRSAEDFA